MKFLHLLNKPALALSGLALAAAPALALTPAQMYAQVSPSVWRVVTYDVDGLPLAQGSGVVVAPEAIVTNCHVLRRAKKVSVKHGSVSLPATLALWDVQRDVCRLQVAGLMAPAATLGDTARLSVGQEVYAIGHPKGLELTMSAGLVSSFRRNEKGQLLLIQTSAAVSAGSSGGGLFDAAGRLVGLVTIGSVGADTQNLNFAVPADWVSELPERHARQEAAKASAAAAASAPPAQATTAVAPPPVTSTPAATATATAAAPAAPVPAPAAVQVARSPLEDLSRLPYANDRMRERYSQFLTRPLPRAFVISESGDWRLAWGASAGVAGTPAERALRECEALKRGRCFVYAVDNQLVYRGASN